MAGMWGHRFGWAASSAVSGRATSTAGATTTASASATPSAPAPAAAPAARGVEQRRTRFALERLAGQLAAVARRTCVAFTCVRPPCEETSVHATDGRVVDGFFRADHGGSVSREIAAPGFQVPQNVRYRAVTSGGAGAT